MCVLVGVDGEEGESVRRTALVEIKMLCEIKRCHEYHVKMAQ